MDLNSNFVPVRPCHLRQSPLHSSILPLCNFKEKEIGALIKGIQTTVAEAITAMEEGAREVENGVTSAHEAGEALGSILSAAEDMAAQVKEVTTAAQSLTSMADEMQQLVRQFRLAAVTTTVMAEPQQRLAVGYQSRPRPQQALTVVSGNGKR